MYGKISGILMPILAIGGIGLGVWGYQENQEKNSVLIKAENQYQNSFHNLNYHVGKLQDELGKTIAVNSRRQLTPSLTNVWRLAYSAQHDVGQLPLTLMPFNKTEEFLSNVADFSYQTAVRDLDKNPLTPKEYKTLQTLYQHSKDIHTELQKVQTAIIQKHLRWMDVESALATEDKPVDNSIIDGLRMVDKNVQGYRDVDFGAGIGSLNRSRTIKAQAMKGMPVTAEQAKQRAADFVKIPANQLAEAAAVPNGKGTEYESYSVRMVRKGSAVPINVDVAKRGGHVVWLMDERDVSAPKLSLREAHTRADAYLKAHNYDSMDTLSYSEYGGLGVFTYIYKQGDVRVHPDTVTVKVALDNGEITGFQSEPYLLNHHSRKIPQAKLTMVQARKRLNPAFRVNDLNKAIIENDRGDEVYTYEFYGSIGQEHYRIFINALTGDEEKVEKIKGATT
ncbi:germination protein YpeB [Aneurinibacillus terranovensis]|uniref:germination protein YpeB n=1 Tax=Aneurinibacillus terranovensis TaxID=278991 RepID=UPI0004116604|nr:germination protein YpeB [Aneurinibacillus terranovensis]